MANPFAEIGLRSKGRLALKLNITDVAHDLSTGLMCRGGVEDESDALIVESSRTATLDLLNRRLRERSPDLESTDLDFGRLLRLEDVRLIAIENNGDTDFDDYIAITGRLTVQTSQP